MPPKSNAVTLLVKHRKTVIVIAVNFGDTYKAVAHEVARAIQESYNRTVDVELATVGPDGSFARLQPSETVDLKDGTVLAYRETSDGKEDSFDFETPSTESEM